MNTCHALFVLEGSTDVTLLRTCLCTVHGAEEIGPLHVRLQSGDDRPVQRRKVRIGPSVVGLFDAFGKDNAVKSYRQLVNLWHRGLFPQLRLLALVVDLDSGAPAALHDSFLQRMEQLAQAEEMSFAMQQRQPAWAELGRLKVTQVLVGDPESESGFPHTAEDHILQFLRGQRERDPASLSRLVAGELGKRLTPKQQVLLSMVRTGYWSHASGFYERVLRYVPDRDLRSLSETLGLDRVCAELEREPE